jgi:hypothetical protein
MQRKKRRGKSFDIMGLLKIRNLAIVIAIIALYAAPETRGNSPYLKLGGPPALRFSLAMVDLASLALPASLTEKPAPANTTEVAVNKADTTATNAVPLHTPAISSSADDLTIPTNSILPNTSPVTPAASDMLVVSPQMLTEYFKPGPDGTNSANTVILPVAVGFTPPSAKPSSRATYNSP